MIRYISAIFIILLVFNIGAYSQSNDGSRGSIDPTLLSPDSLCGIYGNDTLTANTVHRLVPRDPGGQYTGFGVDSARNNKGIMWYWINGTVFKPTPTKPDTAYVTYRWTKLGQPNVKTYKIPVKAAWDHTFLGVLDNGKPYLTSNFCATNSEYDTLAVAGPDPVWEYLNAPSAIIDKSLGVIDSKIASSGKDLIGKIKVGNSGFCGRDTTISVVFVKPPEVEIIPRTYCDEEVRDPANFSRVDTVQVRIPKGPMLAGSTGKKTLNASGFDPNTEVKVYYGSISATGWPQAIDQNATQFNYNYWDGNIWMSLPQVARYRMFSLPTGKNRLKYHFSIRYRQHHPSKFWCASMDSTFITKVEELEVSLNKEYDLCGKKDVQLDAGSINKDMSYRWNTNDTTQSIHVSTTGTYTVTVTKQSTNCTRTKSTSVINSCVGIEENMDNGELAKVFPNPASDIINIRVLDAGHDVTDLKILNLLGEEISNLKWNHQGSGFITEVDISELGSGVYFFKFSSGSGHSTHRVIVE
ncbi:MAG: hypothetical protein CL840_16075 [Crocinitomicaceae bacterium]|nr:hypothetical protein [Crocinitomicaceae bacterium]|tara:strand:+ start:4243 stop:5814 length:1572 start_codon:yes stop_codon:yes gene_type:complete